MLWFSALDGPSDVKITPLKLPSEKKLSAAASVTSRACLYAWGLEPGASLGDAHGGRPWVGGVMWWHFCQHEPTTTPTPEPHEYWLSHYYGGAQDFINTGSNHRRRNRSPAWLLAHRSAQWSQSGAEDGTEDRLGDSGDKVG